MKISINPEENPELSSIYAKYNDIMGKRDFTIAIASICLSLIGLGLSLMK